MSTREPMEFGSTFLRVFAVIWAGVGLAALATVVWAYIGDPPPWNRVERLVEGVGYLWVALLHYTLALHEDRRR